MQGKLGWALGSLAAFLVSAYVGAYFSVAAAAARRLESRFGERGLWLFPFVWTTVEMARSHLFSGFPWMLLGYTLAGSATLRQAADLAGVQGLSFLLALSGVSVYLAGRRLSDRFQRESGDPADSRGSLRSCSWFCTAGPVRRPRRAPRPVLPR